MNNLPRVQRKTKKSRLNGFSLHAIEKSGRIVEAGVDAYVTFREIERAKPSWDRMTNEQREEMKDRARRYNVKVINTQARYNGLGQDLQDVETEKERIEEERNRRRNEIETILKDACEAGELDTKVFYFVSTSYFYEDSTQILPCELAIAKFSLREGVFDNFHIEINPGELPVGAAYTAKNIADNTHQYPLPPGCFGESNYMEILLKIVEFLPPDEDLPIFFCEGIDDIPTESTVFQNTQRIMKLIFESAQEYDVASEMKVYSIIELFYYLKDRTTEIKNYMEPGRDEKSFKSFVEANSKFKLTDVDFRYSADACAYHEGNDAIPHCCLNKCIRFGYVISKWCVLDYKYELKPGCHYPKNLIVAES